MIVFFQFIIALLIGAVIGYVTNYIAIKMLFRPHEKKYILNKIPMPFTPGIIPKKKKSLAKNIGRVTGNVLLDRETFRMKIQAVDTKITLKETINTYINQIKKKDISTISSLVPNKHKQKLYDFTNETKKILLTQIKKYLESEHFECTIKDLVDNELDALFTTKIQTLIKHDKLENTIEESIEATIKNEHFIKNIINSLEDYADNLFEKTDTLEEALPAGTIELILIATKRAVPVLIPEVSKVIDTKEFKALISENIKTILYEIIDNMNIIQQIMVGLIQPKKLIDKEIPNIVDKFVIEIKKSLNDKQTYSKVFITIKEYLSEIKNKKIKDILNQIDKNQYENIKKRIKKSLLELPENKENISKTITTNIMSIIKSLSDKTVKDILEGYSTDFHDKIKIYLSEKLIEFARSDKAIEVINNFLEKNIDYLIYEYKVGKLENYINPKQEKLDELLEIITVELLNTLDENTPNILSALNISDMVQQKIDNFPVEDVEKMIMTVITNELKYINIFGAILGALIGSVNFFINFITNII